jgi:hypothetical protein
MTNIDEAGAGPVSEPSRTKIAERDWIDDAGAIVDEEKATGVRYKFLGRTKDGKTDAASGEAYTVKFGDLSTEATYMLCGFGALTLMGNLTNTWMGEKGERAQYPELAIAERIALLNSGQWIDRTTAGVGARVDKDALVAAYVEWAHEQGQEKDPVAVLEKLTDNPALIKQVRTIAEVNAKYLARVGKPADPTAVLAAL